MFVIIKNQLIFVQRFGNDIYIINIKNDIHENKETK